MDSPTSNRSMLLRHSVSFDDYESFPPSTHESVFANEKESWHSPPENKPKLRVACAAVFLLGLNNAAFGSILPLIQLHNKHAIFLGDFRLMALFLPPIVGLAASGVLSIWMHRQLGMKGVLSLGTAILALSYCLIASAPTQYALSLFSLGLTGFAFGLINTCLSSWIGTFQDVLHSLTILQSWYYLGGIASSVLICGLHTLGYAWNAYYYFMTVFSLVLLHSALTKFRDEDAHSFAFRLGYSNDARRTKAMIREVIAAKRVLGLSLILFLVSGLHLACSSWIPMFMYSFPSRHYSPGAVSFAMECSYWLGLTAGSISLYMASERFKNIFKISAGYVCMAVCFSTTLLLLSQTQPILAIIHAFFLGCFLGPLHTSGMAQITVILPEYLHVIGAFVITSIAQVGLATLPFLLGFLSCMLGSATMFLAFIFILFALFVTWCLFTRYYASC